MSRRSTLAGLVGLALAASFGITGCADNSSSAGSTPTGDTSASTGADPAIAALVPEEVKKAGVLRVGTDATYAPNEFKDANGKPVGWEIELLDAIAAKMGLKTQYSQASFDNIIPGITGGKYDVGLSSFFDTKKREKIVDFLNYYTAGIQWASQAGKTVDPDNACGLTVAVQAQTYQDLEDIPNRSKACTDAGKPAIKKLKFDTQDAATNAVALGRADAFLADSPVTQYGVKQTNGKLQLAGDIYETVPYGMPVSKNSGTLLEAMVKAADALGQDGTYLKILKHWGVESGAVTTFGTNGATS